MWYKATDNKANGWINTYIIDEFGFMMRCTRIGDMAYHEPSKTTVTPKWIWV